MISQRAWFMMESVFGNRQIWKTLFLYQSWKDKDMATGIASNIIPPRRLESLQIVRGLAAILVIFDHAIADSSTHTGYLSPLQFVGYQCGRFGVLVFFVVSGFIMVYSSYNSVGPKISFGKFIINRAKRIVPLYWICTAVAVALVTEKIGQLPGYWKIIGSMLFLPLSTDYGPAMYPLVGQGWTLYYEVFFYMLFAFGLLFSGLRGIFVAISIIFILVGINVISQMMGRIDILPGIAIFYTQPLQILFPAGMIIAIMMKKNLLSDINIKYPITICIAIFIVMIAQFYLFVDADRIPPAGEIFYYILATFIVLTCVFAADCTYGYFGSIFVFLGEASYAIYLTHNFVVGTVSKILFGHFGSWIYLPYFLIAGIAPIVVGAIVHVLVERPIAARLSRANPEARVDRPGFARESKS